MSKNINAKTMDIVALSEFNQAVFARNEIIADASEKKAVLNKKRAEVIKKRQDAQALADANKLAGKPFKTMDEIIAKYPVNDIDKELAKIDESRKESLKPLNKIMSDTRKRLSPALYVSYRVAMMSGDNGAVGKFIESDKDGLKTTIECTTSYRDNVRATLQEFGATYCDDNGAIDKALSVITTWTSGRVLRTKDFTLIDERQTRFEYAFILAMIEYLKSRDIVKVTDGGALEYLKK